MPIRQVSGEMSDDKAAIPSFDPADVCWNLEVAEAMSDSIWLYLQTARVLLERLEAWKHACGYLENHIMMTAKIQTAQAKEYERVLKVRTEPFMWLISIDADMVLKTVANPLREGHHFDQELGGVAGLFGNIRANMQVCTPYVSLGDKE